jgi:hypothetical protein
MRPAEVAEVTRNARHVNGWFSRESAQLFGLLNAVQRDAEVRGDLFEIGVHHGRSTILLCHMARSDERVRVCDLFSAQDQNVSGSGSGDRAVFERNIATLAPDAAIVEVFQMRSAQLDAERIGAPYRFFHIDGGHLAEEALADLRLASEVVDERGVVVVDDPFRSDWPGVTEAVLQFLCERRDFSAVAVGFNKIVICRRAGRSIYDAALADPWGRFDRRVWQAQDLSLVGSRVRVFTIPPDRQLPLVEHAVAKALAIQASLRFRLRLGADRHRKP